MGDADVASGTVEASPGQAPVLRFRLPGTWHLVDLRDTALTQADAKRMAESLLGPSDEAATARILMRRRVLDIAEAAAGAHGTTLFIATELGYGVPFPASLTVFEPEGLHMSPAIGTDPADVIRVFREGLEELSTPGVDDAVVIEGDGFLALRMFRIDEQYWEETKWTGDGPDPALDPQTSWAWSDELRAEAALAASKQLIADYWVTVPGHKTLVLASLSSNLGDMPHALLSFFDAIVGAAFYESPAAVAETAAAVSDG